MGLEKPAIVAEDPIKAAYWDAYCGACDFNDLQRHQLEMLCSWHAIFDRCVVELGESVTVSTEHGEKAAPQAALMKQASAEIRALTTQLGLDGQKDEKDLQNRPKLKGSVISVISNKKPRRVSGA